jgi:hypothetical protein
LYCLHHLSFVDKRRFFCKSYHYDRTVLSKWKHNPDFNERKIKIAFNENIGKYFDVSHYSEILTKSSLLKSCDCGECIDKLPQMGRDKIKSGKLFT